MKKQLSLSLVAGFLVVTSFSTTFSTQKSSYQSNHEKFRTVYFTSDPDTGNSIISFSKPKESFSTTGIDLEQTSRILSMASLAVNSLDLDNKGLSQEAKSHINTGIWATKAGIGLGALSTEDGKDQVIWNLSRAIVIGTLYAVVHKASGDALPSTQKLQIVHAGTEAVFYALTALKTGYLTPLRDVSQKKAE